MGLEPIHAEFWREAESKKVAKDTFSCLPSNPHPNKLKYTLLFPLLPVNRNALAFMFFTLPRALL